MYNGPVIKDEETPTGDIWVHLRSGRAFQKIKNEAGMTEWIYTGREYVAREYQRNPDDARFGEDEQEDGYDC